MRSPAPAPVGTAGSASAPGGRTSPAGHGSGAPTIAHVLAPAPFGGLERVVLSLALGQTQRGYSVHVVAVVAPGEDNHPFVAQARAAGLQVHVLGVGGRAYLAERRMVREICRRHGVEVLHTHGYRPDVVDSGVARELGILSVSTVHGFCGGGLRSRLYEWMQKVAYRRLGAVVPVSRRLAVELEGAGVPAERLHPIPNGWSEGTAPLLREAARDELGISADAVHVGWVGRISREKGLDVMIEALALIPDSSVQLSVIGDGPERTAIQERARELGAEGRIHWHGAVPDAARLFRAFDLFALSSRTEGTPIALFEAIGAGLPVVTTAVGGVPDVVSPAEAVLIPPEDPLQLAEAIQAVLELPDEATARAANARIRLARQFGIDSWLDRYEAVYRHPQRTR